jgi:Ca-activated chloride channel family protein
MRLHKNKGLLFLLISLLFAGLACGLGGDGPPSNAVVINVTANASLGPWLETAVIQFNESETETAAGDPVFVQLTLAESGQAVTDIIGGPLVPDLWLPEEQVWANVLADQGNGSFQSDCRSVATSPLVIAMWRDVAESLGWPGLPLGWLDVGSLAADPSAWDYYSGGQLGDSLRLGHTHPGLSGSGASTLLAIVQAAESKSEAVSTDDIQQPIVQASVSAFEAAVSWFSTDTNLLGQTMAERGVQYLGAAVMYESNVVNYGGGQIVPIYPFEGTFVASHPACLNDNANADMKEAAGLFRDYLLSQDSQQLAVNNGLRPVSNAVTIGAPLDAAHGVELDQPQIIFSPPSVDTIYSVQELWQSARKDVNMVMLIDVSGSMRGNKIDNVLVAAEQFVNQMGDDDYITIIAFSDTLNTIANHEQVGPSRETVVSAIRGLQALGDTALYDAIGEGATLIGTTASSNTTNALVVLTDGQDTFSYRFTQQEAIEVAGQNDTTVFTIAYGSDADENVLSQIAIGANGNFYLGDEASISEIYQEMSAAFGGSVGVGR